MEKIILDTDLGGDCDDVGAIAVLCNLAKLGEAEILALTYCIGTPYGARMARHELDFFGFEDVPLGVLKDEGFMTTYERYSKPYCELHGLTSDDFEDAVKVLRRALASNGGKRDVKLVTIGPLRNIANLLRSEPDEISPLSGLELVRENVSEFVTMLGDFAKTGHVEWNVEMDVPSARYCVEKMPAPIVFSPFELGNHIFSGSRNESLPETHPVRFAYTTFSRGRTFLRESWDPITVHFAVRGTQSLYKLRETSVMLDESGLCVERQGDGMRVLEQVAPDEEIAAALSELMV